MEFSIKIQFEKNVYEFVVYELRTNDNQQKRFYTRGALTIIRIPQLAFQLIYRK